jgi:hypothetical protein
MLLCESKCSVITEEPMRGIETVKMNSHKAVARYRKMDHKNSPIKIITEEPSIPDIKRIIKTL